MFGTTKLIKALEEKGVTRRDVLKFCAITASVMSLPAGSVRAMARALEKAQRPSVVWLSFQECTGCTESLTRSHAPTVESLILQSISLDYHHTLQAAAGEAAEAARLEAMKAHHGKYILVVDGAIPLGNPGFSTIAGIDNLSMLKETAKGAAAVIAVGSCAAFGGLPMAQPNPTGSVGVSEVVTDKPVINIPGCPPIPQVIVGLLAYFLTFGKIPELDHLNRPKAWYGETIHDRCYRRPFYDQGLFAETFDDEGAKKGWCLYKLGCRGPTTYNACATLKWNGGVSFPIQSGHGCLGCSEPKFWDGGGFYQTVATPFRPTGRIIAITAVGAAAVGFGVIAANHALKNRAHKAHEPVTVDDLE
ncbi:MAG: hydrogenase small subunit [Magnetococcales bacterium]|nr:hydrogenase small subunit [Magnetococcales bacterium]